MTEQDPLNVRVQMSLGFLDGKDELDELACPALGSDVLEQQGEIEKVRCPKACVTDASSPFGVDEQPHGPQQLIRASGHDTKSCLDCEQIADHLLEPLRDGALERTERVLLEQGIGRLVDACSYLLKQRWRHLGAGHKAPEGRSGCLQ